MICNSAAIIELMNAELYFNLAFRASNSYHGGTSNMLNKLVSSSLF